MKQWRVWAEDGEVITEAGNVGGSLTLSVKPVHRIKGKGTREAEAIRRAKLLDKQRAKEGWEPHGQINNN
jgi:hypothetical protein